MAKLIAWVLAHREAIIAGGSVLLTMARLEYKAANPNSPYIGIINAILSAMGKQSLMSTAPKIQEPVKK